MIDRTLLDSAIYVDRAYVADLYEASTGTHPLTTITKNEGKKAGAALPIFSAELSATETRSYSISSFQMLGEVLPYIEHDASIEEESLRLNAASTLGWVEANLSVCQTSSAVKKHGQSELTTTAREDFFRLSGGDAPNLALITNPSYFFLGLDTLLRMQHTLLGAMSIPVRAYVRVFAAKSHPEMAHWVAVPLVMLERRAPPNNSSKPTPLRGAA